MRYMKRITVLFVSLFMMLAIGVHSAAAQHIQPSGEKIGLDKEGNAVYQINSNGIKIGYKLIGSGEPLVMIVGLGNTMDLWPKEVVDALSKKYQLILLDNRGMGHTTANDVTFTFKLFADDVIGLLDTLKVEKTNVLGFSMGSVITQELLLLYPQRFNKAVIYATGTDGSNVATTLKDKAPSGESSINPIVSRQIEATTHWKTPLDKLASITNQVMFIVGTSDTVVGTESSKALASAIPGAWLVQFKDGAHELVLEAPTEFAEIVLAFLDINDTVEVNMKLITAIKKPSSHPPERLYGPWTAKDVDAKMGEVKIRLTFLREKEVTCLAWSDIPFVGQVRDIKGPFSVHGDTIRSEAILDGEKADFSFENDQLVLRFKSGRVVRFDRE